MTRLQMFKIVQAVDCFDGITRYYSVFYNDPPPFAMNKWVYRPVLYQLGHTARAVIGRIVNTGQTMTQPLFAWSAESDADAWWGEGRLASKATSQRYYLMAGEGEVLHAPDDENVLAVLNRKDVLGRSLLLTWFKPTEILKELPLTKRR